MKPRYPPKLNRCARRTQLGVLAGGRSVSRWSAVEYDEFGFVGPSTVGLFADARVWGVVTGASLRGSPIGEDGTPEVWRSLPTGGGAVRPRWPRHQDSED